MLKVRILNESGLEQALYGFALSFRKPDVDPETWWTPEKVAKTKIIALKNASRDGGHNKFLEHMIVWLSVTTTLEHHKQLDTYRIGVSKQSQSTMHTLSAVPLHCDHLDLDSSEFRSSADYEIYKEYLKMLDKQAPRTKSKALPQAYKQEREIVLSYKVLRHMIRQRHNHKLPEWQKFLHDVVAGLKTPEYLGEDILKLL
ncbi:MAG: hypothetical protein DSY80_02375 [Desulfocapsa sp.]|nr:MAG: hypothetical protein DSY80_02375 [Desulfocapsa sp.]